MAKKNAVSAVIQREVQRIVAQRTIERVQMCKDAAMIAANEALRMAVCCNEIFEWAQREGVDIDAILKLKHEYNKTRPYKHGGKVM